MAHPNVVFIIPSRIGSTRLPNKAILPIGPLSMIEHVVSRLKEGAKSDINLYVATDSKEIKAKAQQVGAEVILTSEDCKTGSERVYEAFEKIPFRDKIEYVINVQGDMPFINYSVLENIISKLQNSDFDIVTPVVKINKEMAVSDSNVKVVIDLNDKALYFSRAMIPYGASEYLYHVGIYGFRVDALKKFVSLNETNYESMEKLEQLRGIEHGMNIGVVVSNEIPISVDTQNDLEKARKYYNNKILK